MNKNTIKNIGLIVSALLAIFLLMQKTCSNKPITPVTVEQKTDTLIQVVHDTIRVIEKVADSSNQTVREVIVEVADQDAQELIQLLEKEKANLSEKIEDYKKQLAEAGKVNHIKNIHNLTDSIVTKEAKLFYDISAEGVIHHPYFTLDIFKSDTIKLVRIIEQPNPKTQLGLGYGAAYDGNFRHVVGLDLSRKWAGLGIDYVVPNSGDKAIWIAKAKINIKFK